MKAIAATLCFNTPDLVDAMRQQIPGIHIVDNGSEPSVAGATVRVPENRYFSGGWNYYMERTDADWVWCLNSDVQGVSQFMLDQMWHWVITRADANVAAITPPFNSPHYTFWKHSHSFEQGMREREVCWLDWCIPFVNVQVWRELGGFDPQFVGYGADIDYAWRARLAGYKFYVLDGMTQVTHLGSITALRHELQSVQGDTGDMDRKLFMKWGKHFQEMM